MGPAFLRAVEHVDDRVPFILAGAAGEHEPGHRQRIEREFADDEAHLAAVDILPLELRPGLHVEIHAVMAGERGVFDHRHRRLRRTEDLFRQRSGVEQGGWCLGERGQGERAGKAEGEGLQNEAAVEHGVIPLSPPFCDLKPLELQVLSIGAAAGVVHENVN
ncbi:hypothetical protein BOSE62_100006 [Bosea sp. 62]|nr:hypothetical protein BOSE46_70602 [Bosea sp. 46]CAD5300569.1 hypothetical protein BOSE7B_90006 [Bosea sp. 7B]VVT60269.1 hypothetical protein BOS5A_211060 [Bosea sp. EC-HK365B]VXA93529.1 hypothetical protein BOSE62_100006 [Bosea sp. 62]VXC67913.1 hypothetical protein BOSE29B_60023 [Bosea sp. 29B]VXC97554.1 hypothetical protein BOSE125_90024 [Bosea sp. 125]